MDDHYNMTAPKEKNYRQHLLAFAGGFTLLELLISMTLIVVIIVLTMGAMRMGSRSIAGGEKKMETQERFRTVLSIIDAQIQSHTPLTYTEEGNKKYYFRGDRKTLRFTTNYSIWGGRRGYVIADYRIETDQAGKETLFAGEQVPGIEGRREIRFMEASSIYFDYYQKAPDEGEGKWVEFLTEGVAIPEKIRIHLIQGTKNMPLVFPVRVGGNIMVVQGGTPIPASPATAVKTQAN